MPADRKESERDGMAVPERYPWLRCTHGVWTAALSGASKAEQDRRVVIVRELQDGRLVLPPNRGAAAPERKVWTFHDGEELYVIDNVSDAIEVQAQGVELEEWVPAPTAGAVGDSDA